MKTITKLMAMLLVTLLTGCGGQKADPETIALLNELDESLARRDYFESLRLARIDSLVRVANGTTDKQEQYRTLMRVFDEYKSYRYDSAYHYARKCYDLACEMGNEVNESASKCAVSFCLMSAGMFKEASEMMASVTTKNMSREQLYDYYFYNQKLWQEEANYSGVEPYYSRYMKKSDEYIDSLKTLLTEDDPDWWSLTGAQHMKNHRFEEAMVTIQAYLSRFPDTDAHDKAMALAEMAWAYIHTGQEEKALQSFIQSAIYDNESSTREITALFFVAKHICSLGDYDRASRYAKQALDDITFYNARQRKIEIGQILPIIEQDRYNALSIQRNRLIVTSALIALLLLVVSFAIVSLRKLNRQLWQARQTIADHNEELLHVNNQLVEANKIKDVYIGRSFFANAEFIEKMEKLYLTVDRKIQTRQYEDLRKTVRLSALDEERRQMYAIFDETFLNLFPSFVEQYNKLFEESDRKKPADEKSLTSEMRIFALIRLGITDSERIARFLDYSVHTVNTYKTRVKNKSIVENDAFERQIMAIE